MFSATLHSDEVKDIAKRICHQPILIDLKVCSVISPSPFYKRDSPVRFRPSVESSSLPIKLQDVAVSSALQNCN